MAKDPNPVEPYWKRFQELKQVTDNEWRSHWQDLSDNFNPRKGRYLVAESTYEDDKGDKRNTKVINSTPLDSARNLSAGLLGNLTSPSGKWFRLAVRDRELMDQKDVKVYLSEVRDILLQIFSISNFYGSMHSVYEELSIFGTAAMMIEEDFDTVIRCRPFTIGEYFIATGPDLVPNTLYRQFSLTARQLVEQFGIENVSSSAKQLYESNDGETRIKVIQCIQPKVKGDPAVKTNVKFAYETVYFEEGGSEGKFLRTSGYNERPFMAPRWDVTGSDTYGRSPAMDALFDAKMLQKMEEKKLKALDKLVDPPLLAPTSMEGEVITSAAGEVTYTDATEPGAAGVRPMFEVRPDFQNIAFEIGNVAQRIRETFYNDLFQTVLNVDKRMTATEVAQRREEKLALLGPVVNRLQSEVLENSIERTFSIAERMGLLPELPEALRNRTIEIQYVSALAQAQQVVGTQAMEQVAAFVGNLSAAKPEVLDILDFDEMVQTYAEDYGVNPRLVRSDDEVQAIREQRAAAEAAAVQQELITQNAANAKVLSETPVGGNSALDAVLGGAV
jgi:hypothetical protein